MKIELRHIHKRFGIVHANNDIHTTFGSGRIVGVLGENGAGKSTLMKILSGYQPPDSGEIVLDGVRADYHDPQTAIRAGIGMLQQDPLDVPALTVIENFIYGQPGGFFYSSRRATRQLLELCERFGFDINPHAPVSSLTIGQRQQLEIIRLIALGVRTLILDEPTTGISAEQKSLLFAALRKLASEGVTILLVSHKLEDVIALCDEVVVLRAGRLVGAAHMPISKDEIVRMMFGQILAPQTRESVPLGDVVATLENVTVRDKRITINNFSLSVRAGEVIGLAGLDGSGQELLLRAFAGLAKPQQGRITLKNKDMTGQPYHRFRDSGVAFSASGRIEEGLIAGLTLTEHVALVDSNDLFVNWAAARIDTEARIKEYSVRGRPEDQIESLSGGNQQRVLMALMASNPVLMALEQPTRGLDVDSARWIWKQILARRAGGTAILFTSPELDEIVAGSDRIFVAYSGMFYEVPDAKAATIDELGRLIGGDFTRQEAQA